jgi:hypothetical protein|tara:strand:+ start:43 stop:609 length:567 start_codon:yes stop_codon:yes gene_type:complete
MADPDIREIFLALSGTETGRGLLAELAATPDGEEMSGTVLAEEDYQSRPKNLSVGADGFSISPKIYISGGAHNREIPVETMEGPSSIKNSGVNVGGRMGAVLGFPDQSRLTASVGGHFYKGKNKFNEDLQRMWGVNPEERFGSRGIALTDYNMKYDFGDNSVEAGYTPGVEGQKGSDWRVGLRKKWRF